MTAKNGAAIAAGRVVAATSGRVEHLPDEVLGDLLLHQVAPGAGLAGLRDVGWVCGAAEHDDAPRRGTSARIAAVAPKPSIPGMLRSIRTTSGCELPRERDRLVAVEGPADDLDPLVGLEDQLERVREEPLVVGDQDAGRTRIRFTGRGRGICVFVYKALLTGDNRLKQGVCRRRSARATSRRSSSPASTGSRTASRPLVEIRLADLERLAGESPPPAPPDA